MTSIGAYYVFVVATEMQREELARKAAPRRSLVDRVRTLAALLARRPGGMAARPI
jgi:hypothetical protein